MGDQIEYFFQKTFVYKKHIQILYVQQRNFIDIFHHWCGLHIVKTSHKLVIQIIQQTQGGAVWYEAHRWC
jgi:hypothetical protein